MFSKRLHFTGTPWNQGWCWCLGGAPPNSWCLGGPPNTTQTVWVPKLFGWSGGCKHEYKHFPCFPEIPRRTRNLEIFLELKKTKEMLVFGDHHPNSWCLGGGGKQFGYPNPNTSKPKHQHQPCTYRLYRIQHASSTYASYSTSRVLCRSAR